MLLKLVVPVHDTLLTFEAFHFFYNEFFFYNELPQWIPFGAFGIQSFYFLHDYLSPSNYLVGFTGWALGIRDALTLFNVSLLLDQVVLLAGVYLLSLRAFRHRSSVLFVCLTVIGSTVLVNQIWFNFRMFYMLPIIAYLFVRFFSREGLSYLLLSAVLFVVSLFGNLAYSAPVALLSAGCVFAVLLKANFDGWREYCRIRSMPDGIASGVCLLLFLTAAFAFHYQTKHAVDYLESQFVGRDPNDFTVDIQTFLTYGGEIGLEKFKSLIIPPLNSAKDVMLYFGLVPLLFLPVGMKRNSKKPLWKATFFLLVLFGVFSLGDRTPLAGILYYSFPLMKYYRHIGLTAGIYLFALPFLAGFGFDELLNKVKAAGNGRSPAVFFGILAPPALVYLGCFTFLIALRGMIKPSGVDLDMEAAALKYLGGYAAVVSFVLAGVILIRRKLERSTFVSAVVLTCLLLQMTAYQAMVAVKYYFITWYEKPALQAVADVNQYGFVPRRTTFPPETRSGNVVRITNVPYYENYFYLYSLLQWDPCLSHLYLFFVNKGVADVIRAQGGDVKSRCESTEQLLYNAPNDMFGCRTSKLRVEDGSGRNAGSVEVTQFRANRLDATTTVRDPDGALLYYADALQPGWKAFVNGNEEPVLRAYGAFKAVRLPGGTSTVSLVYDNSPMVLASSIMATFGGGSVFFLLLCCAFIPFPPVPREEGPAVPGEHHE